MSRTFNNTKGSKIEHVRYFEEYESARRYNG